MKKTVLRLSLSLCITVAIACAVPFTVEASTVKFNASNFPDANFREAVKSIYPDLLDDGELSDADKKKITALPVQNQGIESIEGVQYFTSLQTINCNNNPIAAIPKLPDSVTKMGFNNCELTKITSLPKNLAYLQCQNNKITSIPNLPDSIVEINVSGNRLKKIEGSFENVYNLFASNNRLEGTFDVSGGKNMLCCVLANNRLTRVVLREGHGYSNLDLKGNFLADKSYVLHKSSKTSQFQFEPQDTSHAFNDYKRASKASLSKSGYKTASCKDCDVVKKLEIPQVKSVKLAYTKTTYSGSKKTPAVTVKDVYGTKLKKGTDYTVTYGSSKRAAVGRYSVTVTFKGNYTGSKKLWFTIVPKAPASLKGKVTTYNGKKAVKLTWSKVSNSDGYYIYVKQGSGAYKLNKTVKSEKTVSYTVKNLKAGKKYTFKVTPYYESSGGTKYKSLQYKTVTKTT